VDGSRTVTVLDLLLMQPPETETGSTSGAAEAVTENKVGPEVRVVPGVQKLVSQVCLRAKFRIAQLQARCMQAGAQQLHSQDFPADCLECNTTWRED